MNSRKKYDMEGYVVSTRPYLEKIIGTTLHPESILVFLTRQDAESYRKTLNHDIRKSMKIFKVMIMMEFTCEKHGDKYIIRNLNWEWCKKCVEEAEARLDKKYGKPKPAYPVKRKKSNEE